MFILLDFRLPPQIEENCDLASYYSARMGNFLATFRDNLSVPSSRVKNSWMGPISCPETSVRNYQFLLTIIPDERCYTYRRKPESSHVENCKKSYCFIMER